VRDGEAERVRVERESRLDRLDRYSEMVDFHKRSSIAEGPGRGHPDTPEPTGGAGRSRDRWRLACERAGGGRRALY
jgi:hypothetical protein